MIKKEEIISILRTDITPAQGCTEPVAIALATAYVTSVLTEKITKIEVYLSQNILKNALGVGIPGTKERGIKMAIALGAVAGLPELQLEVLQHVDEENIKDAKAMINQDVIEVKLSDNNELFWIEVIAFSENHKATAIMQGKHTNLYKLTVDDMILQENERIEAITKSDDIRKRMQVADIYQAVLEANESDLEFLEEVITKNFEIAKFGMDNNSGYGIAKSIQENIKKGLFGDGIVNYATMLTVAGSEARMSGCSLPAMANSGSGNQGITLTVPMIALSERLNIGRLQLLQAVAISHLTSIHVKSYFGILSALCGIVNASIGISAGAVFILGGKLNNIEAAIQNVIGDIAGMICDGAKLGCSLKVATGVRTALNSAILGMSNICVNDYEGINGSGVEDSFKNLGSLVLGGMKEVDKSILKVMLDKENK